MRRTTSSTQTVEAMQPKALEQLLTVADVARILGLSRVKVYALMKSGLPSVKIDGSRCIQIGKLQAWIEQHGQ
jgi:excisionase family DNA binding protein